MNFLKSFFGSSSDQAEDALTQQQQDFVSLLKASDGVFKVMKQETIESLLCTSMEDVEFSILKSNASKTG